MPRWIVSVIGLLSARSKPALAGILATTFAICGCAPEAEETQPAPSPLLYEISNGDGSVEGWMLGTIHALPSGTQWRTDEIERVIDEADYLLVEIANLDDREAIAETFALLATSHDLPELPERIAPDLRPDLFDLIERSDFSASDFTTTETWAAALMLAQVDTDGNPANGVDRAVINDFSGRDVREFEGALDQLRIFDNLPESEQRDLLEGVVGENATLREAPDRLRNAWLTGNIDVLEEVTTSGIMADPELKRALLVDRNINWTRQLLPVLKDPPRPLIAVGAAHLVGPEGLPARLEAAGYAVRSMH